jgi:hypothetical protein
MQMTRFWTTSLPLGVSYVITLGIPPLLFVQVVYGQFFYTSSVLLGAFWIQVIPALMLAYGGFYYVKLAHWRVQRRGWTVAAASLLLLLYIGYIYVNNLTLSITPEKWLRLYTEHPAGGVLNTDEPTIHPRYLLFLAGSFAAGGLALVWRGTILLRWGYTDEGRTSQSLGLKASVVTPILWVVGATGVYFARPADVAAMLSSGMNVVILLFCGIASAIMGGTCAYLAVGRRNVVPPLLASVGLFGATLCMVIFRDLVRQWALAPYFNVSAIPLNAQWGMFALFIGVLAGSVVLLVVLGWKILPSIAGQITSVGIPRGPSRLRS